jgi:nucleotide-binding universal stress UspA family protein
LTFRKILVPYDQSKYAEKALNEAARMAKMIKDSEIIRHHKTGEPTTLSTYFRDLQTDMRYKMVNTLEEVKKKYKNSKVKIRTQVLVGLPVDKIVEFANRNNVDLIVMGRRGLKGISKFLRGLGSVSRSVSEKVNCTVMIVK